MISDLKETLILEAKKIQIIDQKKYFLIIENFLRLKKFIFLTKLLRMNYTLRVALAKADDPGFNYGQH